MGLPRQHALNMQLCTAFTTGRQEVSQLLRSATSRLSAEVLAGHRDRYAAYALNSVLGGSMSSRLFQEIREKRGLAYSIYSFLSGYSDIGTITVYAATRPKEVERVVDLQQLRISPLPQKDIIRRQKQQSKHPAPQPHSAIP